MANFFDYIEWRGDLTFEQDPLNVVDNAIFCQIAYAVFDDIVPAPFSDEAIAINDVAELLFQSGDPEELYKDAHSVVLLGLQVLKAVSNTRRFGNLLLHDYVNYIDNGEETQFSAITISLPDKSEYVAYRGTDNTVVGWKEDFNMNVDDEVPGQQLAVDYLMHIAKHYPGDLYVGGHSKGGNFAMFAGVKSKSAIRNRIRRIYSNDGPGFKKKFYSTKAYADMEDRITLTVPNSSLVGLFFEQPKKYDVVKAVGVIGETHNMITWQVERNGFVPAEKVDDIGLEVVGAFNKVVGTTPKEELSEVMDIMFETLWVTGAQTLAEVQAGGMKNLYEMVKFLVTLPSENKTQLKSVIKTARGVDEHIIRDFLKDTLRFDRLKTDVLKIDEK